jgi:cystathionine beta-lyase
MSTRTRGLDRRGFLAYAAAMGSVAAVSASTAPAAADDQYDFDIPFNRIGTGSLKWDGPIEDYGKDSIQAGMGVADMDFRCAPAITKAIEDRVRQESWGYLNTPRAYLESIVKWNKQRYDVEIDPQNILIADGVHAGIVSALRTFSPPGTRVLMLTPAYDGFYGDIALVGCKPEESRMKLAEGRYRVDFEDLEGRISTDTKTLILCNPHNPTGNCWSYEDLTRLGELCTGHGVVVLADEIHCDFVSKGRKYIPYCTLRNRDVVMNSITFKSASKACNLSTFKNAWMFSDNPAYIARVRAHHRPDLNRNTLGITATLAAYTQCPGWLEQLVPYIDGNQEVVASFVASSIPLMRTVKAEATYLAWLDVSRLAEKIGAKEMAAEANKRRPAGRKPLSPETMIERWLVANAKVHLNPGSMYGSGGENHMRMNVATSRRTVELALRNMAEAMNRL